MSGFISKHAALNMYFLYCMFLLDLWEWYFKLNGPLVLLTASHSRLSVNEWMSCYRRHRMNQMWTFGGQDGSAARETSRRPFTSDVKDNSWTETLAMFSRLLLCDWKLTLGHVMTLVPAPFAQEDLWAEILFTIETDKCLKHCRFCNWFSVTGFTLII